MRNSNLYNQLQTMPTSPSLGAYVFVAVSGTATLSGYFIDSAGEQVSTIFSGSISNTPQSFHSLFGQGEPPLTAVGFVGQLIGSNLYIGLSGCDGTWDPTMVPGAGYPIIEISEYVVMGRVA